MAVTMELKKGGVTNYHPINKIASQLTFSHNPSEDRADYQYDNDQQAKAEAELADAMATVAEMNGLTANDMQHLLPAVLRMLKSNSVWAK